MEEEVGKASLPQAQASPDQHNLDALGDALPEEALDYAYKHDLILDHRLKSFSLTYLFGGLLQSTIPATTDDGFTDCIHLTELELPNPMPRSERPSVTDSALKLICEARRILADEEVEDLTQEFCDTGNIGIRGLKLELPDLGMGYDRDLREFRREFISRRDFHKRDNRIPFDPINIEAGEGLELSAEAQLKAEALLEELEGEKLGITRGSMKFLVNVIKDGFDEEGKMSLILEETRNIRYKHNSSLEKLELPISPRLKQEPTLPPSDTYLIPIPSDPSSSILSDDLKAAEAFLFQDVDKWDESPSPIPDKFIKDPSPIVDVEPAGERLISRKIEMPVVPGLSPAKAALSGPNAFNSFVVGEVDFSNELKQVSFEDFSDDKFEIHLDAMADRTMKSVEQEQLQAADAIARVPVPIMDFSIPDPEWKRLRNTAQAIYKWIKSGHEDMFSLPKWPRDMAAESKLVWRPIGSGANAMSMADTIEASEDLVQSFIGTHGETDIPSSSYYVHIRERLAILDAEDGEDDFEPLLTKFKPRSNLLELVKKRGLEIVPTPSKRQHLAAYKPFIDQTSEAYHTHKAPGVDRDVERRKGRTSLLRNSPTKVSNLLEHFVQLHAPKKLTVSEYFLREDTKDGKTTKEDKVPILLSPPATAEQMSPSKPISRAPYPSIDPLPEPLAIFISVGLARHLIRSLEGLVPNLTLIEPYDADITVSPTSGIFITSMIMIRQKPRPGLVKSVLQERIEKISSRYDRLIILIGGEGGEDDTLRDLSASEITALTEFQGFASGLGCKVVVYYVGGGDDTLSRWVASMVCRYAQVDHPGIQKALLEPETLWELWLRRAGFNVYAAQAVAGQLKVTKLEQRNADTTSSHHGLAAFVRMTRAERQQIFGQLVGLGVLERVSQLVDEIWNKG
ncbi:hypothetical protein VPNG_03259 [Cytospora leucostoma]|uniref:Uncharacterized protein n=1 Tax=Cytospora leucostoma TaxID=1230097 RepID=A0A423XES5_9PEZI|nr:hypothetical protein VPNG_03259 [Cytospora leucostoma]